MSDDLRDGGVWESPEGEYVHGSIPKRSARTAEAKKRLKSFFDEPKDEAPVDSGDWDGLYRCEIVANNSVQDDIVEVLETACPDILYTILPSVHGRGKNDRKLQTATWPETNFVLFAYVPKDDIPAIKKAVRAVKETFHGEGIKLFIMKGCLPEDV